MQETKCVYGGKGLSPNLIKEKGLLLASLGFRFSFMYRRNICLLFISTFA